MQHDCCIFQSKGLKGTAKRLQGIDLGAKLGHLLQDHIITHFFLHKQFVGCKVAIKNAFASDMQLGPSWWEAVRWRRWLQQWESWSLFGSQFVMDRFKEYKNQTIISILLRSNFVVGFCDGRGVQETFQGELHQLRDPEVFAGGGDSVHFSATLIYRVVNSVS